MSMPSAVKAILWCQVYSKTMNVILPSGTGFWIWSNKMNCSRGLRKYLSWAGLQHWVCLEAPAVCRMKSKHSGIPHKGPDGAHLLVCLHCPPYTSPRLILTLEPSDSIFLNFHFSFLDVLYSSMTVCLCSGNSISLKYHHQPSTYLDLPTFSFSFKAQHHPPAL